MEIAFRVSLLAAILALTPSSLPAQQARAVPGARARIHYDDHMAAHVFGETDEAAFYGLGYHHMMEYPIGTLNMLWRFSGRMAEIAGDSYLDEDRLTRLWEVPAIAQRNADEMKAEGLLGLIEAYVAGIEAGRDWWRQRTKPGGPRRFGSLLGPNLEVRIDPVPDYMNQAFSPFGDFDDPDVPRKIRATVARLFHADNPVTVAHVLRLGVTINSFFLYRSNHVPFDFLGGELPPPTAPNAPTLFPDLEERGNLASNAWMVSPAKSQTGNPLTLSDGHVGFNRLHIRPGFVQIWGPRYRAAGLTFPGVPGVYVGYNDHISWTLTAGGALSSNRWEVTLEPSGNPSDLKFQFHHDGGTDLVALEQVVEAIPYVDTDTGKLKTYVDTRHYVPVHPSELAGPIPIGVPPQFVGAHGFSRYPVTPEGAFPPVPGADVVFEQASFVVERNLFEFLLRMGRARNARADLDAILNDVLLLFGDGNNLMVADRAGFFRYLRMARVPIQGVDVPPEDWSADALLDGSLLSWRWQGFHTVDQLPSIGADVSASSEVWINNNGSPDLVELLRFHESDLASFPAYMIASETESNWRHDRADELLRDGPPLVSRQHSELTAHDRTDRRASEMWAFYLLARDEVPGGIDADAELMIQWFEEYRGHDENDQPNPAYDFVAHPFSQVTVYSVLLRSHYEDHLVLLHEQDLANGGPGLTELQLSLGEDPLHPVLADPSLFTYAAYGPNMEAMKHALETVAVHWKAGTGDAGIQNQEVLAALSPLIPGDPWGDPRYDTDISPVWAGIIDGEKITRWGHVNVTVLTPHHLRMPKQSIVAGAPDPEETVRGYFYSELDPPSLSTLTFAFLDIPFYVNPTVVAAPAGGVRGSLFYGQNKQLFQGQAPVGYQESVYGWNPDDSLQYVLRTSGSQSLLSVELDRVGSTTNQLARGRRLAAIGSTEITRPDVTGDGSLAYQKRFAPMSDFVAGKWSWFVTVPGQLPPAQHELWYYPMSEVERDAPPSGVQSVPTSN